MRIDKETFEKYLEKLQETKGQWNTDIQWKDPRKDGGDDFLYHLIFLNPYTIEEWNILGDFKSIERTILHVSQEPLEVAEQHVILAPWGDYYLIQYIYGDFANRVFVDAYKVEPIETIKIVYSKIKGKV